MAVNKNNPVVEGASGRFGRTMVFRQKGALTVMAVRPKPTNKLPTQEQMRQRFLFAEASAYAMDAINDPVTKEAYLAKAKGNQVPTGTSSSPADPGSSSRPRGRG